MIRAASSPFSRRRSAAFVTATAVLLRLAILRSTASQVGVQVLKPCREVAGEPLESDFPIGVRDSGEEVAAHFVVVRRDLFPHVVGDFDLRFEFKQSLRGPAVPWVVRKILLCRVTPRRSVNESVAAVVCEVVFGIGHVLFQNDDAKIPVIDGSIATHKKLPGVAAG
jgi:hypothetical protein